MNRRDLALADSLVGDEKSAAGRTLSDSHFVANFPALARARLELRHADWADAWRAATTAVERGRHGAGRVELAAALLTAAAASRIYPDAATDQAADVHPGALVAEARHSAALRRPGAAGHHAAGRRTAGRGGAHPAAGLFEPLTDRELTILRMLPAPASLRELAADLFVTPNTLKTHLRAIYRKLGAESREEAVIRARKVGLI